MLHPRVTNPRVWIAGAGVSGSFLALRLRKLGYSATIWHAPFSRYKAVESVPRKVALLLKEVAGSDCIPQIERAMLSEFYCFERSAFAECLLKKAIDAGVELKSAHDMPANWDLYCDVLIDATGRAAAWSGPVKRLGREIADLFEMPVDRRGMDRQIVATEAFWAYKVATSNQVTIGVISRHQKNTATAIQEAFRRFGINPAEARFVSRRFCSPQWALTPLAKHRLSVGDAAFAYYPLAGMGVNFALTTAMAAAAVLHTRWRCPAPCDIADEYYVELCEAARISHLTTLRGAREAASVSLVGLLVFSAKEVITGVQRGGFVVPEKAYLLADGSKVRWLGSVDLSQVRDLAHIPVSRAHLVEKLTKTLPERTNVQVLIEWCIQHKLLTSGS
jgi:flavin-dependent dehydrogenase